MLQTEEYSRKGSSEKQSVKKNNLVPKEGTISELVREVNAKFFMLFLLF